MIQREQPALMVVPAAALLAYTLATTSFLTAPAAHASKRVHIHYVHSWLVSSGVATHFLSDLLLRALAIAVPFYALGDYVWIPIAFIAAGSALYMVVDALIVRGSR